jgi:ketosteroid isomerase-like protein
MTELGLVEQVRAAMEAADLDAMRDLLAPDARWGAPGDPSPPCQNREQVLSWYQMGRNAGVRSRVTETFISGDSIIVGLTVTGRADRDSEDIRWQVLTVRAGRIAAITGVDDRESAIAFAAASLISPA